MRIVESRTNEPTHGLLLGTSKNHVIVYDKISMKRTVSSSIGSKRWSCVEGRHEASALRGWHLFVFFVGFVERFFFHH